MTLDRQNIVVSIKTKIISIAKELDCDASTLDADEIIPATGLVDSAGLLDLIAWFEKTYAISIPTQDFTVDNLGSMNAMADYLLKNKGTT